MATKSMAYDNPAYMAPVIYSGLTAAGANGVSTKFASYTAQLIKAVIMSAVVNSTSSTTPLLYSKSGTATATNTLTAITSAATASVYNVLATAVTLAQGDQFWVTHGTDATVAAAVAIETVVIPGSAITA